MERETQDHRLRRLLDLAYDASSYLRRSPSPGIRASAALLLAASLAACSGGGGDGLVAGGGKSGSQTTTVQALTREVRTGLPGKPGRYLVPADSIGRDQQGVYFFSWREQSEPPDTRHAASVSLLRLLQAEENALEMPDQGDPVLQLRKDTPIQLVEATQPKGQGTTSVYQGSMMPWFPFLLMSTLNPRPVYYNPPPQVAAGGRIEGSRPSTTPPSPAERTIGVQHAVSGKAGGTGAGTAVTGRVGSTTSSGSAVSAPKSGGFSSGSGRASSGSGG